MAINQEITNLPLPPTSTDPSSFDARADAFLTGMDNMQPELNQFASEVNSTHDAINASEIAVEADRAEVATNKDFVNDVINYKGVWIAGYNTVGYPLASSIVHNGKKYTSNIENNLDTPPSANWLDINNNLSSIASSVLLKGDISITGTDIANTDLEIMFADGYDNNGALNSTESIVGGNIVPANGLTISDTNYIKRVKGVEWLSTIVEPVYGRGNIRTSAVNPDVNLRGLVYPSSNGGEKVVNGDFSVQDGTTVGSDLGGGSIVGYTNTIGTMSVVEGRLQTTVTNNQANISKVLNTTDGIKYTFKADFTSNNTSWAEISILSDGTEIDVLSIVNTSAIAIFTFVASGEITIFVRHSSNAGTFITSIDNISVFESEIIADDNPYSPPHTYFDIEVEVDINGNPVVITDTKKVELVAEKIAVEEIEVSDLVVRDGFDLGQSLINVTSERVAGIDYINDTGKPIYVYVGTQRSNVFNDATFYINGQSVSYFRLVETAASVPQASVGGLVLNGQTYKATTSGDITYWGEQR